MDEDRRYYVYLHRQLNDHTVFYVGKGTGDRCKHKSKRGKEWEEIALEMDFYWEIYKDNLTEEEAFILETELISNPDPKWRLVNTQTNGLAHDIPNFSDYLYYDETSPSCLRWKVWNRQFNPKSRRDPGDIAGYVNKGSSNSLDRWKVCISGTEYMAHRIVMVLFGYDPGRLVVNHIYCNPLNNKISNLELATNTQNSRRKKNNKGLGLLPHNTSGVNGVRETITNSGKDTYAHAFWLNPTDNKTKNKFFSYSKYGKEEAWRLAIEYRENIIKELWKEEYNAI